MGLLQNIIRTKQLSGDLDTFCIKCKKKERINPIDDDGSYLKVCGCGCSVYKYHKPDEFHELAYFTKNFIPEHLFRRDFKKKSNLEKALINNGFKEEGGKFVK